MPEAAPSSDAPRLRGSRTLVGWAAGPPAAGALALAAYGVVSFLFFGVRLLVESGSQYVGVFADPQIPIWSFAWWLHAIEHAQNPLTTGVVWAPTGVDLAWVNTVPAVSVVLLPLTALAGPVVSYNLAAILIPALSAWAAYLLCRYLTGRFWPSLLGGYLFGFSSYELGHVVGQPQLTAVFVLPLLALVVLRALRGELGRRQLVLRAGALLTLQMYLSMEVAFSVTLALAGGLVLAYALGAADRRALVSQLAPLVGAYALAGALAAPILFEALRATRIAGFQPPGDYVADLANLVVPTNLELAGAGWGSTAVAHFPGNYSEQGSFFALPLLLIVGAFALRRGRSRPGLFLLLAALLTTYFSLGAELTVYGHRLFAIPNVFGHDKLTLPGLGSHYLPLFDNTLPARFALYTALAVSVIVAVWLASHRRSRIWWLLATLGVLLGIPNPDAGVWATTYTVPPFFTAAAYRSCLGPNENVLPQPIAGASLLWQLEDGFRFRLAGGRLQTSPPSAFLHPASIAQISVGYPPVADQPALLRAYIAREGVTSVILDPSQAAIWGPSLDAIARPVHVGGIILYRVDGSSPACSPGPG